MAGTNKTVKLNLNITARDSAKDVFEKFAQNLKSTMQDIERVMKNAIDGEKLEREMKETVASLNGSLDNIKPEKFKNAMDKIANASYKTRAELLKDFDKIQKEFADTAIAAVDATQLTTGQLRKMSQAFNEVKTEQLRDQFQETFAKIQSTAYMTRVELEDEFKKISKQFNNTSLAAKDMSQLTDSAMKEIVESAKGTRIKVVGDMKKVEDSTKKVETSFDKLRSTVFVTRSDLEKEFNKIKSSMGNVSLAATKTSQLTTSQLKNIAESATGMRTQVVRSMSDVEKAMNSAGKAASKLEDRMDFDNLEMVGQHFSGLGQNITGFFSKAVGSAVEFDQTIWNTTAALNAGFRPATKYTAKEFEKLEKQIGITMQDGRIVLATGAINKMKDKTMELGTQGFFSATQVGGAMDVLARQGISYEQIMGGALQAVHDVAAANTEDLNTTADVVADIVNMMGSSLDKMNPEQLKKTYSDVGDAMTGVFVASKVNMNDFLTTMKYVGPNAAQAGAGIKDVATMIGLLGINGIKGSSAGTALRRMFTNLTPASAKASDMMKKLGLITKDGSNQFYDAQGKVKNLAEVQKILHNSVKGLTPEMQQFALKTIFGQYALSSMSAIASTTPEEFKILNDTISKTGTTTDILTDKSKGWGFAMQRLKATFQTFMKDVGMKLQPILMPLAQILTTLIQKWFKLDEGTRKAAVIIGALSGILLIVAGGVATFIGVIGALTLAWAPAIATLGMVGSTLAGLALPITGVIAVLYLLKKVWDNNLGGIQQKTKAVWTFVKQQFSAAINYIKPLVNNGIKAVMKWFHEMKPSVDKAMKNIFAAIKWLTPVWKAAWAVIKFAAKAAIDWIASIIKAFWNVFSGVWGLITHLLSGEWGKAWADVKKIASGAIMLVINFLGGFVGKVAGKLAQVLLKYTGFGSSVTKVFGNLIGSIGKASDKAMSVAKGIFSGGIKILGGIIKGITGVVTNVLKGIVKLFVAKPREAMSSAKNIFKSGINLVIGIVKGITGVVTGVLRGIVKLFVGKPKEAMSAFKSAFKSGINVVMSIVRAVTGVIKGILTGVVNLFKGLSKQAMQVAKDIFKGGITVIKSIIQGVTGIVTGVLKGVVNLFRGKPREAMSAFKSAFTAGVSAVKGIIRGVTGIVTGVLNGVLSLFRGKPREAMSAFKSALSSGISGVRSIVSGIKNVIQSALSSLPGSMGRWASNAIDMFASGIRKGISKVASAAKSAMNAVKDFMGFSSPTKEGPASKSDKWFPNMMNMFKDGIDNNRDKIKKSIGVVAMDLQTTIGGSQEHIHKVTQGSHNGSHKTVRPATVKRGGNHIVVNIKIDGRSAKTDKELSEQIANAFRTQLRMTT